jgi:hypothetical protein
MTQAERILSALRMGPVCGTEFLAWHIPRYAARIHDLRRQGHQIETKPCRLHDHESAQVVYELAEMDQLSLAL